MIRKYPHLIISIVALLLFMPFLGAVHLFDWDEINFAEAAREMLLTGNYSRVQINYEPFWEKPPLFFWMQVLSMKCFGVNEFAARLPNAICGILTLNLIFYYGKKWYSSHLAWWWVLLYIGSFTPHFYFKSGIIDPFFNLFIFIAIVHLYKATLTEGNKTRMFIYAGIFLGLALLTKGPVAIIIAGICGLVYWISIRFKPFFILSQLLLLVLFTLMIPLLWFLPDWIKNGFWFTSEFLKYQADLFLNPVASHGQPWYYHPVVLLIGCFPAAIFAIPYLLKNPPLLAGGLVAWMKILFWVVLILFSMVTTKIVHYSSLCYLPLTFLAAWGLNYSRGKIAGWQKFLIFFIGIIYSAVFALIPLLSSHSGLKKLFLENVDDEFAKANLLFPTNWHGFEFIAGPLFILLIFVSFILYKRKSQELGLRILLWGNAVFLFLVSVLFIPKVENHVQGSIIQFYKTLEEKDIYIETVGFKSYAHYYYTKKLIPYRTDSLNVVTRRFCIQQKIDGDGQLSEEQRNLLNGFRKDWYLKGNTDKPVFLVYKINRTEGMDTNVMFKTIMNAGGYKVYQRL